MPGRILLSAALTLAAFAAQAQEQIVRVGSVRSVAQLATTIAVEKGYFREAGIKVELTDLDTSTDSLAVVAQNRLRAREALSISRMLEHRRRAIGTSTLWQKIQQFEAEDRQARGEEP